STAPADPAPTTTTSTRADIGQAGFVAVGSPARWAWSL
ncbi:MAG: hypothetical protein RI900_2517, partial [Actinomycetota bacterium]